MFSPGLDQCAQAVAAPKTLKMSKAKEWSDLHHMNHLEGHYKGVNSLTLTDHGWFDISNAVSVQRDSLSVLAGCLEVTEHLKGIRV